MLVERDLQPVDGRKCFQDPNWNGYFIVSTRAPSTTMSIQYSEDMSQGMHDSSQDWEDLVKSRFQGYSQFVWEPMYKYQVMTHGWIGQTEKGWYYQSLRSVVRGRKLRWSDQDVWSRSFFEQMIYWVIFLSRNKLIFHDAGPWGRVKLYARWGNTLPIQCVGREEVNLKMLVVPLVQFRPLGWVGPVSNAGVPVR